MLARSASAGDHGLIVLDGNVVMVDEVYLEVLKVPSATTADEETARDIETVLLDFLRGAGYVLASVQAEVIENGKIHVHIDEGRLAKIVLRGKSPAALLAYCARINLPGDVFNRPQLERTLRSFYPSNTDGLFDYELVSSQEKPHTGPQVDITQIVPGQPPLVQGDRYELHIDLSADPERAEGARVSLAIDNNGYRFGAGYTFASLLGERDRWDLDAQFGFKRFDDLRENGTDLRPNRLIGRVRYYTPPVVGQSLRPLFEIREDLLRRQRQDLGVQNYYFNRLDGSVSISVEPENAEINAGFGFQFRNLSAVENVQLGDITPPQVYVPDRVTPVDGFTNVLPFVNIAAQLSFDRIVARRDLVHRLTAEGRYYFGTDGGFGTLYVDYQKVFEFGWNELWLSGNVGLVEGSFSVADAIPMSGTYVRGVYSDQFYFDRVVSAGIEYRFSLTRDLFKIGIFDEAALFREHVIAGRGPQPEVVNAAGPGLHFLVMDTLQVDFYASIAVSTAREYNTGATVRIRRAF
jgi:hypothetical protein